MQLCSATAISVLPLRPPDSSSAGNVAWQHCTQNLYSYVLCRNSSIQDPCFALSGSFTYRRRQLLGAALKGFMQHGEVMEAYRESIAARNATFHAWRARAHAKALRTSLVTARGKLRRQVLPRVGLLK